MKLWKMTVLLALTAMVMYSCGDSKSDSPTGGGGNTTDASTKGSLSTHTGAANAVVTESNVATVNTKVTEKANDVFSRALTTVKYKTAKPAAQVYNLDGKVNGSKSGYAQVKGSYSLNMSGQTMTSMTYNFTCTFYDFADDTSMYMGGLITYTGTYDMSNTSNPKYDLTYKGGLKFNGDYEGTQDFTIKYSMMGQNMSWTSTCTTTSGGKTFTSTNKYPM